MWRLTGSARSGVLVGVVLALACVLPPFWPAAVVGTVTAGLVAGYVRVTAGTFFRSRVTFAVLGGVVPVLVGLVASFVGEDLAFTGPLPVLWSIALVVGVTVLQRVVTGVLELRDEVPASCVISGSLTSITASGVVMSLAVARPGIGSWGVLVIGGVAGLLVGALASRLLATARF